MTALKNLDDNEPTIDEAPLVGAAMILLGYLVEHQTIGLTKTGAFQRKFVLWAAQEFQWPDFDLERYFAVSKILNEYDYPPLEMLHFILQRLKLIRHYKGACRLTKAGAGLADKPGALFNLIAPLYLFQVDHAALSRLREPVLGNWDIFLGVLNEEAKHGVSCVELRHIFYGMPDPTEGIDRVPFMIHDQIVKPLCWMGLLDKSSTDKNMHLEGRLYVRTPLWGAALNVPFEPVMVMPTRH